MSYSEEFIPVIGLEIHVKVKANRKLFSSSHSNYPYDQFNQFSDPYAMGVPGTYPIINLEFLDNVLRFGFAISADISTNFCFDRKMYAYHDVPKNYQLTQKRTPIILGGEIDFINSENELASCFISEAHIEEDTAITKTISKGKIGVDTNRSGVPLIEIVTMPDIHNLDDAVKVAETIRSILLYQNVSECRMNLGEMRVDCNISIKRPDEKTFRNKVEIKNMNSFGFMRQALEQEFLRQIEFYQNFGDDAVLDSSTYRWDSQTKSLQLMRKKDTDQQYCYLPDPDVPLVQISPSTLERVKHTVSRNALARINEYVSEGISRAQAEDIASHPNIANLFEAICAFSEYKTEIANWITSHLFACYKKRQHMYEDIVFIDAQSLAQIINLYKADKCIKEHAISGFKKIVTDKVDFKQLNIEIVDRSEIASSLDSIVANICEMHRSAIENFLAGNPRSFDFLVGQVMAKTRGKADPKAVKQLIQQQVDLFNDTN